MSEQAQQNTFEAQMQSLLKMDRRNKVRNFKILNQTVEKGQILFTGSSLMEGFPIAEMSLSAGINGNGVKIYNRAIGGYTTDDFLQELDTLLLDLEPSVVFINIGTNDIRQQEDGSYWLDHLMYNYEKILKTALARDPNTIFYLMAYYPANCHMPGADAAGSWYQLRTKENMELANRNVAALAAKYNQRYIDLNDGLTDEKGDLKLDYTIDGVHMYASGYEIVFRNLLPELQKYL